MMRTVILAVVLAFFARPADACRCAGASIGDDFATSAVVVVAKVVRVDTYGKKDAIIVLAVESVWKGDAKRNLRVFTRPAASACGRPSMKGRWIVFAQRQVKDHLVTHLCDSSQAATPEALEEMTKQFGKPTPIK